MAWLFPEQVPQVQTSRCYILGRVPFQIDFGGEKIMMMCSKRGPGRLAPVWVLPFWSISIAAAFVSPAVAGQVEAKAKAQEAQPAQSSTIQINPALRNSAGQVQIREAQTAPVSKQQQQQMQQRAPVVPVKPKAQAVTGLQKPTTQNHKANRSRLDCDDNNPLVHPGAGEVCDGLDNDCNGEVDDGVGVMGVYYEDADGDGWGNPARPFNACSLQPGYASRANDCDDTNDSIHPGASDPEGNGVDENCNGRDG